MSDWHLFDREKMQFHSLKPRRAERVFNKIGEQYL